MKHFSNEKKIAHEFSIGLVSRECYARIRVAWLIRLHTLLVCFVHRPLPFEIGEHAKWPRMHHILCYNSKYLFIKHRLLAIVRPVKCCVCTRHGPPNRIVQAQVLAIENHLSNDVVYNELKAFCYFKNPSCNKKKKIRPVWSTFFVKIYTKFHLDPKWKWNAKHTFFFFDVINNHVRCCYSLASNGFHT